MKPAIIELVDSEIRGQSANGTLLQAPGYALLEKDGVVTGEAARRLAWLQPQQSFSQFWHQLTLAPLPAANRHARHYADLAYAQLHQLFTDLDEPGEVVFVVPGSFSREQLAILLGLARALPTRATGLVDAAVAASCGLDESGEVLHLDMQLHQAVITRIRMDEAVERLAVDLVPEVGIRAFQDSWAQFVANQFIREYRYDPLHVATGEQQLYDKLPDWLRQLGHSPEATIEMTTPRGDFRLVLQRDALLANSRPRLDKLAAVLAKYPAADRVFCSHRVLALPGVCELVNASPLPENSAIAGCLASLDSISGRDEAIDFVTRLPRQHPAAEGQAGSPSRQALVSADTGVVATPTHLLYHHRAYPIDDCLAIHLEGNELRFSRWGNSPIVLKTRNGRVMLDCADDNITTEGDRSALAVADTLRMGDKTLTLIQVAAADEASPEE